MHQRLPQEPGITERDVDAPSEGVEIQCRRLSLVGCGHYTSRRETIKPRVERERRVGQRRGRRFGQRVCALPAGETFRQVQQL